MRTPPLQLEQAWASLRDPKEETHSAPEQHSANHTNQSQLQDWKQTQNHEEGGVSQSLPETGGVSQLIPVQTA